jgi:hypothetical protein
MADSELRQGSDPRLRIVAHAIRHEQQGEITLMRGVDGRLAVGTAFRNISPTTSILSGMERFNGTPVERIISRMDGSAARGGVMEVARLKGPRCPGTGRRSANRTKGGDLDGDAQNHGTAAVIRTDFKCGSSLHRHAKSVRTGRNLGNALDGTGAPGHR